jgi:hypothetical protein
VKYLAIALALFASPAFAQQPAPSASPMEQALAGKLGEEYNQNIQLRASMVQLQAQLKAAQDQVKAMQDKTTEPPK